MKLTIEFVLFSVLLTFLVACRNISNNDTFLPDYAGTNAGAKTAQQNLNGSIRTTEFSTEADNGGGHKLEIGCKKDGHFGTACYKGGSSRCKLHECESVSVMRVSGEYTEEELEESQRIVDEFIRNGGGDN